MVRPHSRAPNPKANYGYLRMGDVYFGHMGRSRASDWNIHRASPLTRERGICYEETSSHFVCTLPLALFPGVLAPQFAQNASTVPEKPDKEKHNHALLFGLIRTINTAESTDFYKFGSYASWQTLLAHQPDYLNGWLARFYSQEANVHFGDLPEILPGWNLRLNVQTDGQRYVVLLEDATDKTGYAALSDERAALRECKLLQ